MTESLVENKHSIVNQLYFNKIKKGQRPPPNFNYLPNIQNTDRAGSKKYNDGKTGYFI